MKIAPLYHALAAEPWCTPRIVHTGQHYDANMSDAFFADLGLPKPHVHLGVGSGGHGEQTGRVMIEYEKVCLASRPGLDRRRRRRELDARLRARRREAADSRSRISRRGCAAATARMPEEINRLATDAICDLLWTPSRGRRRASRARGRCRRTRSSASATS